MDSVRPPSSAHSHNAFSVSPADQKTSMMRCPKCGDEQKKSDICTQCGVVVEKYLKIKKNSSYQRSPAVAVSYMNDEEEGVSPLSFKIMAVAGVLVILVISISYLI